MMLNVIRGVRQWQISQNNSSLLEVMEQEKNLLHVDDKRAMHSTTISPRFSGKFDLVILTQDSKHSQSSETSSSKANRFMSLSFQKIQVMDVQQSMLTVFRLLRSCPKHLSHIRVLCQQSNMFSDIRDISVGEQILAYRIPKALYLIVHCPKSLWKAFEISFSASLIMDWSKSWRQQGLFEMQTNRNIPSCLLSRSGFMISWAMDKQRYLGLEVYRLTMRSLASLSEKEDLVYLILWRRVQIAEDYMRGGNRVQRRIG